MYNNSICKAVADCWLHYFQTRKEVKENEIHKIQTGEPKPIEAELYD